MIKKITTILLTALLMIPVFGYFDAQEIKASGGDYVVQYIKDNGKLEAVDSYGNLEDAIKAMKKNNDYVVTHKNSLSPMKIIAMNSGLAYSYPYRSASVTMNLYERVNSALVGEGVTTYLPEHYEMTYHSTYSYYPSKGYGWIEVTMNGFHGYADLENTDLVPMKYVKKGLSITLGGNDRTGDNEQPFNVICKQNYYKNENGELKFVFHRAWPSNSSGDCLEYSLTYGKAELLQEGKKYYSNDGIHFFLSPYLSGDYITYYNYYQFLPLRTKTSITADEMNAFINANNNSGIIAGKADHFIRSQNNYGCNAAIILAMAIHESAWGTSNIARGKNNLFGWGAFDSNTTNATRYSSVEACVSAQMGDNLSNYMDPNSWRYFSMSLGNKGGGLVTKYASDPYWAEKIASYYYRLDKSCGFKDLNSYKMAVVNTNNASVYKEANTSTKLYGVANKSGYQKNVIVTPLGDATNGLYKTYTSVPSGYCNSKYDNSNGVTFPIQIPEYGILVDYDFDKCFGYMKASDIEIVQAHETEGRTTGGETEEEKVIEEFDPEDVKTEIAVIKFDYNKEDQTYLDVGGYGLIRYIDFIDPSVISHKLVFKNSDDRSIEYVFDLTTKEENFELFDGYKYNYVAFEGSLNLKDLPLGNYITYLRITNGNYTKDVLFKNNKQVYRNKVSKVGDVTYRLTSDYLYSYRFELGAQITSIDYEKINKPRAKESYLSIDSISYVEGTSKLKIDGTAFMYGLDFGENNNVEYNLYLENSIDNTINSIKCPAIENSESLIETLKSVLGIDNSLTHTKFEFEIDVKDINGTYNLVLEIKTTNNDVDYYDYIYLTNKTLEMPTYEDDNIICQLFKSETKNRIIIKVSEKIIEE